MRQSRNVTHHVVRRPERKESASSVDGTTAIDAAKREPNSATGRACKHAHTRERSLYSECIPRGWPSPPHTRASRNAASTADTLRLSHLTSYSLTWTRAPTAHRSLGRLTVRATHGDDRTGGYTAYPTHARRRAHQVSTRKSHRWRGKPPMAKLPPGLPELVSDGGGDDGMHTSSNKGAGRAGTKGEREQRRWHDSHRRCEARAKLSNRACMQARPHTRAKPLQ